MNLELPSCITNLFESPNITIDDVTLGDDVFIVYAHGKFSKIMHLKAQAIKAFENTSPLGNSYFSLYLICKDKNNQSYQIAENDINLNKSKIKYTNNYVFSSQLDADYYLNLCVEFNIHSSFEPESINNS